MPEECGGGVVRLRVTSDEVDEANNDNREEWCRACAPGDPDYPRLIGIRNDAESGNWNLDRYLEGQRAHSVGRDGILINCMTWAAYRNAQAVALYGQRARVRA